MWLTALVFASFYARERIGRTAWRMTHYASFAGYGLGFAHGVAAGPDATFPPTFIFYSASGV